MQHKSSSGFDGPTVMNGHIRGNAAINAKLVQQAVHANAVQLLPNADPQRTSFIVRTHRDDRVVKARIPNARHREQQLAG